MNKFFIESSKVAIMEMDTANGSWLRGMYVSVLGTHTDFESMVISSDNSYLYFTTSYSVSAIWKIGDINQSNVSVRFYKWLKFS